MQKKKIILGRTFDLDVGISVTDYQDQFTIADYANKFARIQKTAALPRFKKNYVVSVKVNLGFKVSPCYGIYIYVACQDGPLSLVSGCSHKHIVDTNNLKHIIYKNTSVTIFHYYNYIS